MKEVYCCQEHVEYGIEEVLNEIGVPPKLEKIQASQLPTKTCEYCGQIAEYIVSN